MFDANMRHMPKGKWFFAEGRDISISHPLIGKYNGNHVFLCTMLSNDRENPLVRFHFTDGFIDVSNKDSGSGSWFVYAGNIDGSDFINNSVRSKALMLIDEWEDR